MEEWIIGALINLFGSVAINYGTNLLKLGHDERNSMLDMDGTSGKLKIKPIIYFRTWRTGVLIFIIGNVFNFISFGYAAQSLLAALGSIQFVSNIAFAYFVLQRMVTIKVLIATASIILGNVFLVAFGNHQSAVFTPEQLAEKYTNVVFLIYCLFLILIVVLHQYIYRRGKLLLAVSGQGLKSHWHVLLPFSYAVVSGAIGSWSVLFAKSVSNLLRLATSSSYHLDSWFTCFMILLFLITAGFWMARLNKGLSLFDAILIVPMFQIVWTFFSICTGFVYFQEYQVIDVRRTVMFILGTMFVFVGIILLPPNESKGGKIRGSSKELEASSGIFTEADRLITQPEESQTREMRPLVQKALAMAKDSVAKAKVTFSFLLHGGEELISASVVLVMPMVSSKITGFRGNQTKILPIKNNGWSKITTNEDAKFLEAGSELSHIFELKSNTRH